MNQLLRRTAYLCLCLILSTAGSTAWASASAAHDAAYVAGKLDRDHGSLGERYRDLNDTCRGESDPAVYGPACEKRDHITKKLGRRVQMRFARAWAARDTRAMKRLSDISWGIPSGRATMKNIGCTYDESEPLWHCWVPTREGVDQYVTSAVVALTRQGLPIWRVTGMVPDGV